MQLFTFNFLRKLRLECNPLFVSLVFFILIMGTSLQIFAQSSYDRQLKYWYLRDRLRYFIAKSNTTNPEDEDGSYMVIVSRNANWNEEPFENSNANYGQQSSLFGKYIGVLATEYHLLMQSGKDQEALLTNTELLSALQAQKRRDFCEHFYGYNDEYNGYFVRCDIPPNSPTIYSDFNPFIASHQELNTYEGLLVSSDALLDPNSSTINVRQINKQGPDDPNFQAYEQMSQDEVIFTLEGLALAYHFGSIEVKYFSRELAIKILEHCWGQGSWVILGYGGTAVPAGSDCRVFSWGFSAVADYFNGPLLVPCPATAAAWSICYFGAGDDSNRHMVASLTAIGGVECFVDPEVAIYNNCDNDGWQTYYLWLHMALWDDYSPFIEVGNVEDQLDQAPCGGPWRLNPTQNGGYGWCTTDRWCHNHDYLNGNGTDPVTGIFTGLDYMLLLNLYYICNGQGSAQYRNRMNAILDESWPSGNIGSNNQPLNINNFRTITSTEQIKNYPIVGNVNYYAGTEIILEPGFNVAHNAFFSASIEPLDYCQNQATNILDTFTKSNAYKTKYINDEYSLTEHYPISTDSNLIIQNEAVYKCNIYPNPSKGFVTIKLSSILNVRIIVQTADGRVLIDKVTGLTDKYNFDIENLENGLYIVKIISNQQISTEVLIKI